MSIKKKNSGINKKGKRRYNRTLCTQQTEQIYQELDTYIPSMDGVKRFRWYGLEKIKIKGDPKWLSFVINDIHFEIEVYVYQRTKAKTPFRYFPDIDGWPHREKISITNYWFLSVCYRNITYDRFGLSSYFFENKSQKVLRMIYNEDDLEEWEDFDY